MAYTAQNTLPSFAHAAQLGADWVEFDVRQLADGTLVAHHDKERDGLLLADLTWEQLHARWEWIPTVQSVLTEVGSHGMGIYVDIKEGGCAPGLARLLKDWDRDKLAICSWSDEMLAEFTPEDPTLPRAIITGQALGAHADVIRREDWRAWERAQQMGIDIVVGEFGLIMSGLLGPTPPGKRLWAWNVNSPAHIPLLMEQKVEMVVSDWPDLYQHTSAQLRLVPLHNASAEELERERIREQLIREQVRDQVRPVIELGQQVSPLASAV